ncbi:hypothetical protein E2562_003752 [Oryza meyeriana var. granulata]|uniref:Uncharacterized protein n=1 Tax=Oryza meyeriana var. granulata TaxID=110450 RepID=A0A6G1BS24_9ORYZ|nr:hypothetical protein E2562_003752 [Oryza meyeriana var. granulata]
MERGRGLRCQKKRFIFGKRGVLHGTGNTVAEAVLTGQSGDVAAAREGVLLDPEADAAGVEEGTRLPVASKESRNKRG